MEGCSSLAVSARGTRRVSGASTSGRRCWLSIPTESRWAPGGTVRIDYLGAQDYGWLNLLIAEFLRYEGRRWREMEQRLREPFDGPTVSIKLQAAAKVLRRLFSAKTQSAETQEELDPVRARLE